MLLASLVEAFQEDACFSHLKEMPYVKEDRLDDDLNDSILDFIEQVEVDACSRHSQVREPLWLFLLGVE